MAYFIMMNKCIVFYCKYTIKDLIKMLFLKTN